MNPVQSHSTITVRFRKNILGFFPQKNIRIAIHALFGIMYLTAASSLENIANRIPDQGQCLSRTTPLTPFERTGHEWRVVVPRMINLYSTLSKKNNHSAACERVAGRPTARHVYLARWAFAEGWWFLRAFLSFLFLLPVRLHRKTPRYWSGAANKSAVRAPNPPYSLSANRKEGGRPACRSK